MLQRPVANEECGLARFEPAATTHTGKVLADRTRSIEEQNGHLANRPDRRES